MAGLPMRCTGRYTARYTGRCAGRYTARYTGRFAGRYTGRFAGSYTGRCAGRYTGRCAQRFTLPCCAQFTLGKRIALSAIGARYARQHEEERAFNRGAATQRFVSVFTLGERSPPPKKQQPQHRKPLKALMLRLDARSAAGT